MHRRSIKPGQNTEKQRKWSRVELDRDSSKSQVSPVRLQEGHNRSIAVSKTPGSVPIALGKLVTAPAHSVVANQSIAWTQRASPTQPDRRLIHHVWVSPLKSLWATWQRNSAWCTELSVQPSKKPQRSCSSSRKNRGSPVAHGRH